LLLLVSHGCGSLPEQSASLTACGGYYGCCYVDADSAGCVTTL
jgi:hypothetical protein